jgi:hypothetical protein
MEAIYLEDLQVLTYQGIRQKLQKVALITGRSSSIIVEKLNGKIHLEAATMIGCLLSNKLLMVAICLVDIPAPGYQVIKQKL